MEQNQIALLYNIDSSCLMENILNQPERIKSYPSDALSLEHILKTIQIEWQNTFSENACALYRNYYPNDWHRHDFIPGNNSSVKIDVKAVLRKMVEHDSDALILCHSHTHNDPRPSQTDIETTAQIASICRILGVEFIDHIIFAESSCFSFRKHGYI